MIKLNKQPEPEVLTRNKVNWTKELLGFIDKGEKIPENIKNRYNHQEIKSVLRKETNGGKCMYCESPIAVVAPEHIEHYKPKKDFPELTYDWDNLGLSCPYCNINKGNVFDKNCPYINPYIDIPDEHFIFSSTMIFHKPGNKRAQLTELQLDLNRPELIEARKTRIDMIRNLIDLYVLEDNPTLKAILKNNIDKEIANDTPYSMYTKAIIDIVFNN